MNLQKTPRFESKPYRDWVKTLPSCISGQYGVDCHHIKGRGCGGTVKPSDLLTMPLTREEHTEFHNMGWESWEKKYNVDQRDLVLQTIMLASECGVVDVTTSKS